MANLYTTDNQVRLVQYAEAICEDIGLLPTIEQERALGGNCENDFKK